MNSIPTINIKGQLIPFDTPWVMGILNVTPDSFYAGSRQRGISSIRNRIETILSEGGDVIDIGGYSSRPNAEHIGMEEEWGRLKPALAILCKDYPDAIVSVDTFRAEIAKRAVLEYGASIINDISGGDMDTGMFETIATLGIPYILMHIKGTPQTMQQNTDYDDILEDIMLYFEKKLRTLHQLGVHDVIIDPGFGFSKTIEQNYTLMRSLWQFKQMFDAPLLIGISRKSMIYKLLGNTPDESLAGTTALNTYALQNGADMLRVHDVKAAVDTVKIVKMLKHSQPTTCNL